MIVIIIIINDVFIYSRIKFFCHIFTKETKIIYKFKKVKPLKNGSSPNPPSLGTNYNFVVAVNFNYINQ